MKKLIALTALALGLALASPTAAGAQTPTIPPNPSCTTSHPGGEVRQTWNVPGCASEVVYPEYGKTLAVSPGGGYVLAYQSDGNLVEYGPGGVVFATNTDGYVSNGGTYFLMNALTGKVGINTNIGKIIEKYARGTGLLPKPVAGQPLSIRIDAAGVARVFIGESVRYTLRAPATNRDTAAL